MPISTGPLRRLAMTLLLGVLAAACAARSEAVTGVRPSPFPGVASPFPPRPAPTPGTPATRSAIIDTALAQRGVPYRLGGDSPSRGFDCSGFIRFVLGQHAFEVPRTAAEQFRIGSAVKGRDIQAGDLVFFTTVAPGASHVGLAIDAERFVHAPASTGVVRVEQLSSSYWSRRFVGARRLFSE